MTFREPLRKHCACRDCKARRSVRNWVRVEKILRMVRVKK